jgi:putative ABC transport system ATP-binding protein
MSTQRLQLHHLSHQWTTTPASSPLFTLDDLQLNSGDSLFMCGPSGCGKSTLLNIITGLLPPTRGEVLINGQSLYGLKPGARDRLRAQCMGVITQSLNLLPYLTVAENLRLMQTFSGQKADSEWQRHLLQTLNLTAQAHQRVEQLSIGQQQRAAIARALIHKPSLIIADEPTSALDDDNKNAFMSLLLTEMQNFDTALLMVSHDTRLQPHFSRTLDLRQHQSAEAYYVS